MCRISLSLVEELMGFLSLWERERAEAGVNGLTCGQQNKQVHETPLNASKQDRELRRGGKHELASCGISDIMPKWRYVTCILLIFKDLRYRTTQFVNRLCLNKQSFAPLSFPILNRKSGVPGMTWLVRKVIAFPQLVQT